MHVKIQGGGQGKYANTGSSFGCVQYFNHENIERIAENKSIEPFFDHQGIKEDFSVIVSSLDQNKAKLGQKDAKFFVLTISPSEEERAAMGGTETERSAAMKSYTREVMDEYAKSFGKGLTGKDLLYYAKIHHNRGEEEGLHAHIIVSRKSKSNKIKLSPKTNHRNSKRSGTVKSAFNRSEFFRNCEDTFDLKFKYERLYKDSYEFQNAIKNGSFQEKEQAFKQADTTPIKPLLENERKMEEQLEIQRKLDLKKKELSKQLEEIINPKQEKEMELKESLEKIPEKNIQEKDQEQKEKLEQSSENKKSKRMRF